jgi:hypothetical protein
VLGYCVRCKAKQEMLSATRTLMKNGRRAMIGLCACCGTKMSVAGVWEGDPHSPPSSSATILEEVEHANPTILAPHLLSG